MSRLALPYDRFASRRAPAWSRPKGGQVIQKAKGVEPEPRSGSDLTSDPASGFTDVTSDMTDFSLAPPSPGALESVEQGTLGAAGAAGRRRVGPLCAPSHFSSFLKIPPR